MKKVHFPAKYVEIVIARNLKKHKLMKHEEMMTSVTRHIEARNLTRNKDIIMKTFQNIPVTIVTILFPTEVI